MTTTPTAKKDLLPERRYRSLFCAVVGWPRHPGLSGGEIRDFHLLRRLLSLSRLEFFAVHGRPVDGRADPLARLVDAVHDPGTVPPEDRAETVRHWPWRVLTRALRLRGWPVLGTRYAWDTAEQLPSLRILRRSLQQRLERTDPDFLFVSPQTNPVALLLDTRRLRTRLIMASYDVEAVRMRRFVRSETGLRRLAMSLEARRAARFERKNLKAFDGVIAVSDLDKSIFVGEHGFASERVLVLENGVDPAYFAFHARPETGGAEIVFVGTMSYLANEQAAWRLVGRIMPLLRRTHPEARLSLVGQSPSPALLAQSDGKRTVVTGTVDDVRPYLARATAVCVPLIAGAGTKYKVLEALSAGAPVVCSPLAVEGLELADERHLLVAESDEGLAAALRRLIDDPQLARRLAAEGRRLIETRYAWDANLPRLDAWLDQMAALPKRHP